jgi:hypothetical protein
MVREDDKPITKTVMPIWVVIPGLCAWVTLLVCTFAFIPR